MKTFDLIIKNGHLVLETGVKKQDIGIKNGKIEWLGHPSTATTSEATYNAEGQYIFPGMIDTHVHFNEPGREIWEGFHSGSAMMAAGGATMFFDMPLNGIPSTTTTDALFEKATIGNKKSFVDFGLWGGLVPGNETHIQPLAEAGVIGFKAFLSPTGNKEFEASDDFTLLKGMEKISQTGKILALHAESGSIIQYLSENLQEQGALTADDYLASRPIKAEVEAVERALHYASITDCALHFVHISSQESVEKIEAAKKKGMDVSVETCAHYLLFNHQDLKEHGTVAKCAPPLREQKEQMGLIQLLKEKRFDFITSDHSPCPPSLKDPSYNIFEAWGGISGGQYTLLTMVEISLKHHIPFEQVAALTASNPADRFNLTQKGKIEVGRDADFAILNMDQTFTVSEYNMYAKHKHSLYMNHTFPCRVEATFSRGKLVYQIDGSQLKGPSGQWIKTSPEEASFSSR